MKIAILDDYQRVALTLADWSGLARRAEISVFSDVIDEEDALAARLAPFDILCVMRERTRLNRALLERLPRLKLIASTGAVNAAIDVAAARERGIEVLHTSYSPVPAIEMTWALILASQRHVVEESGSLRSGGWQRTVGTELNGRRLGLLGLGNIGSAVARIGVAFGMEVLGWSQHLTSAQAHSCGAVAVSKDQLFRESDILSVHTLLSRRTRGLISTDEIALMKSSAWLINTSRGPIVNEPALIDALRRSRIRGYAVDVFELEPLPQDHPFRTLTNVLATPHVGYVTESLYRTFYGDSVRNIEGWFERAGG